MSSTRVKYDELLASIDASGDTTVVVTKAQFRQWVVTMIDLLDQLDAVKADVDKIKSASKK